MSVASMLVLQIKEIRIQAEKIRIIQNGLDKRVFPNARITV